ncbi:MAG: PilZ domain-containing protein [Spirochaetia bacterium]|nr:PilZ domain-containing protein [Spirochaetia bacterium]
MEEQGNETKKINDTAQLQQIAAKVFARVSVSLVEKSGEKPVRVTEFKDGLLFIEHDQPESPVRVLTAVQSEHRMLLECKVMSRSGSQEQIRPVRLHLSRQVRREKRIEVADHPATSIWISNCLPVAMIPESLGTVDAKRDALVMAFTLELKKRYSEAAIILRRSMRSDSRMRTLLEYEKPIYFCNDHDRLLKNAGDFVPLDEYEKIRKYDNVSKLLHSEICEPIWYHGAMLVGYVQVLASTDLTEADYQDVRQYTRRFEQSLLPFLPSSADRCPVVDIHHTGVGFLHPHNNTVLRSFFSGAEVVMDLNFADGSHFTCFAVVRNVKSRERTHRIGAELHPLKPEQSQLLEKYLSLLAKNAPAAGEPG